MLMAVVCGCATTKDSVGGGDARLDEAAGKDAVAKATGAGRTCGPDKGDLVLIDARTGGPVTCLAVTVSKEPGDCAIGTECPSDQLVKGFTGSKGHVTTNAPFEKVRLAAVADGYGPSYLFNATKSAAKPLELELAPADGFWLKVLDGDGNYLQNVLVTFKEGDAVLAQVRSNVLANVFFTQRQPFGGQPVTVEAEGYAAMTVSSQSELGDDGHTLTLKK